MPPDFKPPYPCEYFPVPSEGRDPFFEMSRSWWFARRKNDGLKFYRRKFKNQKRGTRPEIRFEDAVQMFRKSYVQEAG